MMGGALLRQGVSDYIRKQSEQAVERKPLVVFLHDLCFKLLPWVPALVCLSDGCDMKCKPNGPFLSTRSLWSMFYHSTRK